jgi:DNA-binding Xre family transcriptional regulator
MELTNTPINIEEEQEVRIGGKFKSHVPDLLIKRGWEPIDLIRKGMSVTSAYRAAAGETEIHTRTLLQLCDVFEVKSIDKIFEYTPGG